jgi:hypothetical protein
VGQTKTSYRRGKSGNPGGRPRKFKELVERCRDIVDSDVVEALQSEVIDGGDKWVECAKLLLAYGYGKPTERIEAKVSARVDTAAKSLTLEQLEEVARIGTQQRLAAQQEADDDDDEPSPATH